MRKKPILRMHPLPWDHRTEQLSEGYSTIIYDANGHRPILDHLREDEALDIVTAVNAHEAMKDALQNLLGVFNTPIMRRRLEGDEFALEAIKSAVVALALTEGADQ